MQGMRRKLQDLRRLEEHAGRAGTLVERLGSHLVKREIRQDEISQFSQECLGEAPFMKYEKLVADLHNRKNYKVHILLLQKCLQMGVQLVGAS